MNDMTVTVVGTRQLAERACRMVFGEDTGAGPICPAPEPLLAILENWPKDKTDQAVEIALELPADFNIERELPKDHRMAVTMRACRVTVLHRGHKVGFALRTNQLGINAIKSWQRMWTQHEHRLRGKPH